MDTIRPLMRAGRRSPLVASLTRVATALEAAVVANAAAAADPDWLAQLLW